VTPSADIHALLTGRHPAMGPDLLEGLRHCAGHGYATGWGELSTTTVFQVYLWRQPWVRLALPDGALREVEPEYTGQVGDLVPPTLVFSEAVRTSLLGLCAHASKLGVQVTFHDLFFDLARHGDGRCARRLREHGVDRALLDTLSERLGLGRLSRFG
jgi:hypothetical protein